MKLRDNLRRLHRLSQIRVCRPCHLDAPALTGCSWARNLRCPCGEPSQYSNELTSNQKRLIGRVPCSCLLKACSDSLHAKFDFHLEGFTTIIISNMCKSYPPKMRLPCAPAFQSFIDNSRN